MGVGVLVDVNLSRSTSGMMFPILEMDLVSQIYTIEKCLLEANIIYTEMYKDMSIVAYIYIYM